MVARCWHYRILWIGMMAVTVCAGLACTRGQQRFEPQALRPAETAATTAIIGSVERAPSEADDAFLAVLREQQAREGRENAMLHYQLAALRLPAMPKGEQNLMVGRVMDEGWSKDADALLGYVAAMEPAFEAMRTGAAIEHFEIPMDPAKGFDAARPNYSGLRQTATMLIVQGRWFESQRRFDEALDNYITVARVGRHLAGNDSTLITSLVGVAIEGRALRALQSLLFEGELERPALERALAELRSTDRALGPTLAGLQGEERLSRAFYENLRGGSPEARETVRELYSIGPIRARLMAWQAGRGLREHREFWDAFRAYVAQPFWLRDRAAYERRSESMVASFSPLSRTLIPNFLAADTRYNVMLAQLRLTETAAALALYRSQHGRFPESLAALTPGVIDALPVDPFSGKPMQYAPARGGDSYRLYSFGPDLDDDGGEVRHDSKNGTISDGDILAGAA